MARVTIEDCLKKIDNAYDIVSLASQRAKDLLDGSEPKIDYPGKPSVVALKEIAEGLIDMSYFDIRRKQKIEEQLSDAIAEEEAISDIAAESEELAENMDTELVSVSADTEGDTEAPVTDSITEENTEDKPA
ncbi:MAG: DNA-directed RNA polymerase subunit omega [Pseudomonadota bacterium]|nr:DNA-directed RNA polymerase subunit omega [Pseudomonadota bacterium]